MLGKDFALKCRAIAAEREAAQMADIMRLKMNRDFNAGKIAKRAICYGYDICKVTGKWTVNREQAGVVKQIYSWYLGGLGVTGVVKKLHQQGTPSPTGNEFWSKTMIKDYLSNERFWGHQVLQKTYKENGKVFENKGERPFYRIDNHHEPIISEETFEKASEIMAGRTVTMETGNRYDLTSRIICGHCGTPYKRVINNRIVNFGNVLWDCRKSNSLGKSYCVGGRITDELIKELIKCAYNEYLRTPHDKEIDPEPVFNTLNETSNLLQRGYTTYKQFEESSQMHIDEVEKSLIFSTNKIGYNKDDGKFTKDYHEGIVNNHVFQIEIKEFGERANHVQESFEKTIITTFNNGQQIERRYKFGNRKYARSL